ncbi:MAG: hypothetical protein K2G37_00935 [Clostridia bacterium]|nr:hypothetical protein [Clostridia bacterium]MDE7328518.1 hypothetical protein [Clostridia bacterium]
MKKKIIAIVAVVLVVVLTCSLAACSKSMFDGSYKKEATSEQAKSSWDGIRVAFGIDSASLATASSDSEEIVKGWTGVKFTASDVYSSAYSYNGEAREYSQNVKSEGSFLFDGSAMAVSGAVNTKNKRGDKSNEANLNAGIYIKEDVLYTGLTIGDASLNVQFPADSDKDIAASAIKNKLGDVTDELSGIAINTIGNLVYQLTYSELMEYTGIKAYIDDSGKYNRIKYVFSADLIYDLYDTGYFGDDFQTAAKFGDCSIIIVTDKETNSFQGAKISYVFSYENDKDFSISVNSTASIENCSQIKASYPSNLKDYKNVKDISIGDVTNFLKALNW